VLSYISFTALTTVGFGDIVPVDPIARMAAALEALTGQLFPVILIARLVSLQVQSLRKT
jgi:voltage-gated potassium channel Kch